MVNPGEEQRSKQDSKVFPALSIKIQSSAVGIVREWISVVGVCVGGCTYDCACPHHVSDLTPIVYTSHDMYALCSSLKHS